MIVNNAFKKRDYMSLFLYVVEVGLVTLSMVLTSVGLPVEGIALIMGIDRLLDMTRTVVNITGDAVCTLIVAKKEKEFDQEIFYNDNSELEEAAI